MAIVPNAEAGLRVASRATILQLRNPALGARDLEREAVALVASSLAPVVISSRCDIAMASGAAGVHLPERDIGTELARRLIRRGLVGRSVHSLAAARRAEMEGADYLIFGPVWSSQSHPDTSPVGTAALAEICAAVRVPVLAIGGVTAERVDEAHAAGASGYAAIGIFS
jgi:thiamine-phosphate pyrophosphorylase